MEFSNPLHKCSPSAAQTQVIAATPWPSPKSARTPRARPTTCGSEPTARAIRKRCAVSNGGSPTSYADNSAATQTDQGQAREDTRGRLYRRARPARTPHADASDKSLPGPATSHPTTPEQRPLDTERRRLQQTDNSNNRCRVSFRVSYRGLLTWAPSVCLTSFHMRFVSLSVSFPSLLSVSSAA